MTAVEQARVRVGTIALPAAWLLLVAAAQAAALILVWRFFVRTERGQLFDTIALAGNQIGQDEVDGPANTILNAVSVVSLAVATVVIAVIALARGRVLLTVVVTLFVIAANVTSQMFKWGLYRPNFGVDPERLSAGNSFPSGHATVAMSVAIALVLVLPPRARGVGAVVGAVYAGVAGVATMSLGWHRPSDVVGSVLIAGAWAAVAGFLLVLAQGREIAVRSGDARPFAVALLALAGVLLLVAASAAFQMTDAVSSTPIDELGRRRLLIAYAGAAAGITGATAVVMALILSTVHRIVPWKA